MKANQKYMKEALEVAKESNCQILQVGAVVGYLDEDESENPNQILLYRTSACNGTYPGESNCNVLEFETREQHHEFADKYEFHAEMNALAKFFMKPMVSYLLSSNDTPGYLVMYVTHYPCNNCIKLMRRFGIKKVFYLHDYKYADHGNQYAKDMNIQQIVLSDV